MTENNNKKRAAYEAICAYQLSLEDSQNWNEDEFNQFKANYQPHNKSHEQVMLGFIRHITLIKNKQRDLLSNELRIPEGIQSKWVIALQRALKDFWQNPEISSTRSLEILRSNKNRSQMPSLDTSVVRKIVELMQEKKAEEELSLVEEEPTGIDFSLYESVLIEYLNDVITQAFETEIKTSEADDAVIKEGIDNKLQSTLDSLTTSLPLTKKVLVDPEHLKSEVAQITSDFIKNWFSTDLVRGIRNDLMVTALSKVEEGASSIPNKIPDSVVEQIYEIISKNEVLEINGDDDITRYFIEETDLFDYYVSANLSSTYPKFAAFRNALFIQNDAKVILGANNARYYSFPVPEKDVD